MDATDVFISYSTEDKHIADAVCHVLEEESISCWIAPRDVLPGITYAKQIIHAIKECKVLILIFSKKSNVSEHVGNEIDRAFNANKPIIPFVIEETSINEELDYYLSRKHWLVAYPDYKEKTAALVTSVLRLVGRDKPDTKPEPQEVQIEENAIIQQLISNMVSVEGGTFMMGTTPQKDKDANENEYPLHRVTLSSYSICKYPVTQAEWQAIMNYNPSKFIGSNLPVERVSWNECLTFIDKLNRLTGRKFRLPTEAEWEYSARGGIYSRNYRYSGNNNIELVAWTQLNSGNRTHPVGEKMPNELGLYDMSGNVCEWCQDIMERYISNANGCSNPTGPHLGAERVFRGGCWADPVTFSRISFRSSASPEQKGSGTGFRLAL